MTEFRSAAIIIPVFNDGASLRTLLGGLGSLSKTATSLLIVDDGSSPALTKEDLGEPSLPGIILRLKRNVGHQRAIALGLAYTVAATRSEAIVIMDGDGEDRPEDVPRLLKRLAAEQAEVVVVGERRKRGEGAWFIAMYHVYRLMFLVLTGQQISFGNFCAMRINTARRLIEMSELWMSLPATILRSRLAVVRFGVERGIRYEGKSRMNFVALVLHGLGAMAVFLEQVLARMILIAAILVGLGLISSAVAILVKLTGAATPGWLTTTVGTSVIVIALAGVVCLVGLLTSRASNAFLMPSAAATYTTLIADAAAFEAAAPSHSGRPDRLDQGASPERPGNFGRPG